MPKRVDLKIKDKIATVTLNRPDKLNAFDLPMFKQLDEAQQTIAKKSDLRAVVITGKGPDFSSGLDVKSIMGDRKAMVKLIWKWLPGQPHLAQRICVGWRKLPVPVIVAIQGRCYGAGVQLALGGDYRIAHTKSTLSIMEAKWGLIPDMGGSLALREIAAMDQAMKISMTAEEISAKQAEKMGLVSEVVADPMKKAMELCEDIKTRSPDCVAGIKKLYHKAWHHNDRKLIALEWAYQWRVLTGKNLGVAIGKQKGKGREYFPRRVW